MWSGNFFVVSETVKRCIGHTQTQGRETTESGCPEGDEFKVEKYNNLEDVDQTNNTL